MGKSLEVIYEHGLFRPLEPVELPEHQRVRVTIEDERPAVSRADFVCDSLEQVAAIVRGLRS